MAEKKKTGKSSTGRSGGKTSSAPRRGSASKAGSGSRSKGEAASGPRPRKGFWGVVLLALGVFMLISYFSSRGDAQSEGKVVAFFANVIKGLVGWGFWLTVPAFLFAGFLLLAGKDKPVGRRAVCALLLPLVFSALAEVLVESQESLAQYRQFHEASNLQNTITTLYSTGILMKSTGVLGGYLGKILNSALSVYGAFPFLLVLFLVLLIVAVRGSLRGAFKGVRDSVAQRRQAWLEAREQEEDEDEDAEEDEDQVLDEPVRRPVKRAAPPTKAKPEPAARPRRPAYAVDVPLREEDEEPLSLRGPSLYDPKPQKETTPKRATVRRKPEEKPAPKLETFQLPKEPEPISQVLEREYPVMGKSPAAAPMPPKKTVAATAVIEDPPKVKMKPEELQKETQAVADAVAGAEEKPAYQFPPVELLRSGVAGSVDARDEIKLNG